MATSQGGVGLMRQPLATERAYLRLAFADGETENYDPRMFAKHLEAGMERSLPCMPCIFDVFRDGFEALDGVQRSTYDAVILSAKLPNMDAVDTLGFLAEVTTGLRRPAYLLTYVKGEEGAAAAAAAAAATPAPLPLLLLLLLLLLLSLLLLLLYSYSCSCSYSNSLISQVQERRQVRPCPGAQAC